MGIKTNTTDIKRLTLIKCALELLNSPYLHGSHGPESFDCAGFVWYLYHQLFDLDVYQNGYGLSTTTRIMTSDLGITKYVHENQENKNIEELLPGDILFFHRQSLSENYPTPNNKYPGHCAIYLEDNLFIHASYPKKKVIISSFVTNPYWYKVLVGSKDILSNSAIYLKK